MAKGTISYPVVGGNASGYLSQPARANGKGILVLHEWWGISPHVKDVADRFAQLGYVALAPDFFDGKRAASPEEAQRFFTGLSLADAANKLRGAVNALRARGIAGRVGVLGLGMGGKLALYAAGAMAADIGACVDFYGIHPNVKPNYATLVAPVLAFFGKHDRMVAPAHSQEIVNSLRALGRDPEIHLFPAGHSFFNDSHREYHAPSAQQAWKLTTTFFAQYL